LLIYNGLVQEFLRSLFREPVVMRWTHFFFSCFLLSFFSPFQAFAELPDISAALETRLYQGTAEEITSFVGQRQAQVDGLGLLISADVQKMTGESEKVALAAVLDLYQGLSFQLKNLQAELGRPEVPPLPLPSLASPPYPLAAFDEMVSYQQKIVQQLAAYEEMRTFGEVRLGSLKDELTALLPQYVKEKADENGKLQSYERLARIFSLQHEYALFQLKKPKLEKELTSTRSLVKESATRVAKIFGQLQISQDDLAFLQKKVDLLGGELATSLARLNAESLELSKQGVVTESKLDKVVSAIAREAKEGTVTALLESEKSRFELVLEAIRIRQRAIINEKMNLGLTMKSLEFRQAWLTAYVEMAKGGKPADFVDTWQKSIDELLVQKDALVGELSQVTQQRSDQAQRVVSMMKQAESVYQGEFKVSFARQAEKTTQNLDVLILGIADNVNDIRSLHQDVEMMLRLLLNRMDTAERFFSISLSFLKEKWEQARTVLYYPLVTLGVTSVTLISFIKVIFLILIGIRLLKLIRQKTAAILTVKTAMSPGAVNSITTLVYYAALVLGCLVILSTIGFNVSQLGVVFGALGVGIGFGLQTIFNNFVSGIILLTEQSIQVGDYVQLQTGVDGKVKKISIRATVVRTFEGEDVIVPNSEFVSSRVNTWSYSDNWRRLKVPFGVSYDTDPDEVVRLAEEAAREVSITREDADHPVRILFEGFGNNSLDFSIRPWCWMNKGYAGMLSEYYFVLFRKFKAAGIEIPFPQTDLHLKSISPEVLALLQNKLAPQGQDDGVAVGGERGDQTVG
jgi:small-conductance mechanosensitive channel